MHYDVKPSDNLHENILDFLPYTKALFQTATTVNKPTASFLYFITVWDTTCQASEALLSILGWENSFHPDLMGFFSIILLLCCISVCITSGLHLQ